LTLQHLHLQRIYKQCTLSQTIAQLGKAMRAKAENGSGATMADRPCKRKITSLQNDPQQHWRGEGGSQNRKCRAPRGSERIPDSESARNCCRNQVSVLMLVNKKPFCRPGWGEPLPESCRCRLEFVPRGSRGAPLRGHQSRHGSGRVGFSVQQENYREPPSR
jgi:hypothetical protein